MIILQTGMMMPYILLRLFLILTVSFLVIIVIYNSIIKKIKGERAKTIHPIGSILLSFILTLIIYILWIAKGIE